MKIFLKNTANCRFFKYFWVKEIKAMKKSPVHCRNFITIFKRKRIYTSFMILNSLYLIFIFSGCDYFFPPLSGENLPVEEASNFILKNRDNKDVVLLDIRTKREFDSVKIEGSVNLDFTMPDFPEMVSKLDKEKRYIIIDQNGIKGAMAAELLKEERFTKVHFISGGIESWIKNNLPVQK